MNFKRIGLVLWALVLVYGGFYIYQHLKSQNSAAVLPKDFDGREFAEDLPWRRLPHLTKQFVLTEQSGEEFDSRSLAGKPYVLSFFFTRCPTICRDLNKQIGRLANRYKDSEATFIGMSVDAKYDQPEVLREYLDSFEESSDNWLLLTGKQHVINEIATNQLLTRVDGDHHTPDIFLIDRWGRYRDRFKWDDPREMKRFNEVMDEVLAETKPPVDKKVTTRNVIASLPHPLRDKSSALPWLQDFELTDSNDQKFHSRELTGTVWVASFFFSRCGTVCPKQNKFLSQLQPQLFGRKARLVSITTKPQEDTPEVLRTYAKEYDAEDDWLFLTGDKTYIDRIGSEFLLLLAHGEHHSSTLAVIDRWGNVRGRFDWQTPGESNKMLKLIDQLNKEEVPVVDFEVVETSE